MEVMIGIIIGSTISHILWLIVWSHCRTTLDLAEQYLRDSHAREEALENLLEQSGESWKIGRET